MKDRIELRDSLYREFNERKLRDLKEKYPIGTRVICCSPSGFLVVGLVIEHYTTSRPSRPGSYLKVHDPLTWDDYFPDYEPFIYSKESCEILSKLEPSERWYVFTKGTEIQVKIEPKISEADSSIEEDVEAVIRIIENYVLAGKEILFPGRECNVFCNIEVTGEVSGCPHKNITSDIMNAANSYLIPVHRLRVSGIDIERESIGKLTGKMVIKNISFKMMEN
jgi:hypothetical protein